MEPAPVLHVLTLSSIEITIQLLPDLTNTRPMVFPLVSLQVFYLFCGAVLLVLGC